MIRKPVIALALLVFWSALHGEESPPLQWEPFTELAGVRVGDSREQVISTLGQPSSESERIIDYTGRGFSVYLTESGQVYGFACGSGCGPERALAARFKYRTKEQIGINSTEEAVIAAYGKPGKRVENENSRQLYYTGLKPKTVLVFVIDEKGVANIHSANMNVE